MRRIEAFTLVGDLRTAALIARDGTVVWGCFPRFDSPAAFAALLGTDDDHGAWHIGPADRDGTLRPATHRRYRPDSLVCESTWTTPDGTLRLTDFMPPGSGPSRLVRIVEAVSGRVAARSRLRVRADYGRIPPRVTISHGRSVAVAGPQALWLDAGAPVSLRDGALEAGRPPARTIGRVDEARTLFEKLLALRNDVGLLAEEWDPARQRLTGNFPQAFSHLGLVDSAAVLERCAAAAEAAV
ncbi:trehalase-like domain-containing protein [Streptomyces albus]|uniref:trehalase-like domain-containing protein n=1 Tax=Streptomyces albus TaxID=1888 RepID=UPI0036F7DDE7